MSIFWFVAISLHILAAITWIGGMTFLSFVLAPLLRKGSATPDLMTLFRAAARRFRADVASLDAVVKAGAIVSQVQNSTRVCVGRSPNPGRLAGDLVFGNGEATFWLEQAREVSV